MKKKITIFLLFLFILLWPNMLIQAKVDKYELKYFKPGIWNTLDNLEGTSNNPEDWIQSGRFCYEFLDSQKKYITIRDFWITDNILTIPGEIDGHKVLGVGSWVTKEEILPEGLKREWVWGDEKLGYTLTEQAIMKEKPFIREIKLPEGLEFLGGDSFGNCNNMKRIHLPDSLAVIADGALSGATDLEEIQFPPGVYVDDEAFGDGWLSCPSKMVLYSDCHMNTADITGIFFPNGKKTELDIRFHEKKSYYYSLMGYITKLRVDKRLSGFQLEMAYAEWDDSNPPMLEYDVKKLIMNGKNTKLKLSENVNKLPLLHINDYCNSGVKCLYTVKGAEAIKEVKKYKIPYYWKETGRVRKVKAKKKNGTYSASWKKSKTTLHKCEYKFSKKKVTWEWQETKNPAKTIYKVYGKKKKSDGYQFIKTLKKRSIKSKYKYIKAVPVKEWD